MSLSIRQLAREYPLVCGDITPAFAEETAFALAGK
jgi:hypothetical protein